MHDSLSIDEIKELFFTDEEVGGKLYCILSAIFFLIRDHGMGRVM